MIPNGPACLSVLAAMPEFRITNLAAFGLALLIVMAGVWLALIAWLFHRLGTRHPSDYETMGSPGLFRDHFPRSALSFLALLFSPGHRRLRDAPASRVVLFLRVFLGLDFVAFFVTGALI